MRKSLPHRGLDAITNSFIACRLLPCKQNQTSIVILPGKNKAQNVPGRANQSVAFSSLSAIVVRLRMTIRAEKCEVRYAIISVISVYMVYLQRYRLAAPLRKPTTSAGRFSCKPLVSLPQTPGALITGILNKDGLICQFLFRVEFQSDIPSLASKMRSVYSLIRDYPVDCPIIPAYRLQPELTQYASYGKILGNCFPYIIDSIFLLTHSIEL